MKRIFVALVIALLAACSPGQAPRAVTPTAAQPDHADFGPLRVRHTALPSLGLNAAMARQYGIQREEHRALLLVNLRELRNGEEMPATGRLSAQATDLQGERQAITLKPVPSGDYVDYIGSFATSPRNAYRIRIEVEALGRRETVDFQREF